MSLIKPRTLKGFPDYLPDRMIPREQLMEKARRVFRSYGYAPIDTPAVELQEVLLAKMSATAEINRQLYRFQTPGKDDVVLRFDLTVPLARFAAQYVGPNPGQIPTPFKRYALGTVWRGESPQSGRYREFMQCDFDIIGTTANGADIETALVIHDLMAALGLDQFEIRINNRLVLNGLLDELGLSEKAEGLLRSLDKLAKQGPDAVVAEMTATEKEGSGISREQADRLIGLAELTGSNDEVLAQVERDFGRNAKAAEGIARLRELLNVASAAGIPGHRIKIDLSICRGLDYYTGTIYETFLLGTGVENGKDKSLESFGSVCSGGRYDNLAKNYTKQELPGVGASLGLDRLLAVLEAMGRLPKVGTAAPVLVVQFTPERLGDYHRIARVLRAAGIGAEVYPDSKKIGPQLQYAEKRGFQIALIAGPDEFAQGTWKLKHLASRTESTVAESELSAAIQSLLKV
jgi:histidyl-tRNA synthetase